MATTLPLSLDDVRRAHEVIRARVHRTPTFSSATLSERIGATAHLKAELFQRTGSFKPRGVLNVLAQLSAEERSRGVIGVSAGNHAQSLAYCAALEGVDCLVVMWQNANPFKRAATIGYGAAVDDEASGPGEAFDRLHELMAQTGRALVHPFDDPRGQAGAGTVGLELLEDVPHADVVVVPVGGGGLISGIAAAVKGARPQTRIVAVEPEGSAALHEALAAGHSVPVEPNTIASGLDAPFAGENVLAICRELVDETVLVTDDEIAAGMRFLYGRAKLACEPAGAAATGALLAGKVPLEQGETVVSVVSGGNVAPEIASAILAES
ncbi:MAG: threonine dehydratase [Gaiellaceae bacterium]|nr:threonine dehydratase [Gaiellaceae bacterium]